MQAAGDKGKSKGVDSSKGALALPHRTATLGVPFKVSEKASAV